MESRVRAVIGAAGGLVTARDLHAAGFDGREVARWARTGVLVPVRRGVYTTAEQWERWDEYVARPLARIRAAELTIQIPHVLSHDSAALVLGLPLIDSRSAQVHLTRRDMRGSHTRSGVRHHGAAYSAAEVVRLAGTSVLSAPRTVLDIARTHGYRAGLVAADGALRLGTTDRELAAAADRMFGWPGSRIARAVVADADAGAQTPGETLMRELVLELGVGDVETQFPVPYLNRIAWVDLRAARHLFEFDGRVKYQGPELGGVSDRPVEQVLWEERRREREICRHGLGMSRLVWGDFFGPARERAKEQVRQEIADTERRFGSELPPHLAEFAARHRAQGRRTA